jgi:hypothetical protein
MTKLAKRVLFWTPRILSIAFIAFLSLFALDVFQENLGFWRTALAFVIHLIPVFALIGVLILAWRWEWIGAVLYGAAGVLYIMSVVPRSGPMPAVRTGWILIIAGPAFTIAGLFLANWLKRRELKSAGQQG